MSLILGIDPGSRITGFGIVRHQAGRCEYVTSGCIRLGDGPFPERLQKIFQYLSELITQYQPTVVSIEQVFMARNPDSALKLGQARGAAIVAAVNAGLAVNEYSARQVKQSVVGTGAADKKQVQHMVTQLLSLAGTPQADAADALAIALCHAHLSGVQKQLGNSALAMRSGRLRRR
ncbi:crossover junction endodeoxyribonuclease RuvC [Pseudomonas neustonica]|uniref:Crossover junction endodeoxyribonuclease RuvC n=1 Tax=Pseudomonas neustonica TaxID=2487346 RepID=A0ABX9XEG5_9PSED|nr:MULTISPECIES: crossover junction endodeoxyribonuclease RuvC [Pseudomonas]ROZ80802.1 crossover junction endodeoxyribonuclease RuvC [Pseudomonas sp. SSM44]ROZ82032.1 crossover junction endodeoxyribonuclease RuvC [Pseudomonas neustonica]|tara:strand:+ start:250 stop:777 length:528 start_codon:yes stop_codon:yes gene_type:complete